ncbi:unnamed protein product, partial [Meganyctiphanes norvegica]
MFAKFYNMETAQQIFSYELLNTIKSEELADKLRTEGNQYFQEKTLEKAFKLYTRSIMSAPHPRITKYLNKEKTNTVENGQVLEEHEWDKTISGQNISEYHALALGYANRSAVQFEMKHYGRCIVDIELAIKHGYPLEKREKLIERKFKCLVYLKRFEEACEFIKDSIKQLQNQSQSEKCNLIDVQRLNKLVQYSQHNIQKCSSNNSCSGSDTNGNLMKKSFSKDIFKDLGERNPVIPNLSNAVTMRYTADQGRFLVAQRNIQPGEMLVAEKAQSSSLLVQEDVLSSRCTTCMTSCHNPIPCPNCNMNIFSSKVC